MAKEMLINVSEGEECRIALLDNGKLEELYMERTSSTSHVGNIYKGKVTNVEPSIQAAFVDFGLGRNGFLHISDLMPSYFGRKGEDIHETVGRKMARRDRPPIQRCLRRGDEIIVQIIKEGIGTKGPTLSTYLSIPGRILVMMPGMGKMGVSRKIEDEEERRRLRQILDSLKPPKDVGFIIRTAGIGKSKTEIQRDLTYLSRLWSTIEKKRKEPAPVELYTEGDLVTRTVRDVFSNDVDKIIVDSKDVAKRVKEVIKITNPRTKNRVDLFEEPVPLFHKYGIEKEIELMYSRHVPLPSGGSLVIDSTEAIVAIDVNSGKFRDHADAETTAFKTDMEAAEEIPRQLKLRDLGGVIICDFIDLRYERHRRELEQKLHDNFKKDRAKTKVLRMSQFGIIELTRQRMRPSLKRSIYFDCPHCKGAGLVKTPESMSLDVMRRLAIAVNDLKVARVELSVCPDVSFYLLNKKRRQLAGLEEDSHKKIIIRTDATLGLDEMKLDLFDSRDGVVILEELGMVLSPPPHVTQLGRRGGGRGRFDDRRQRGGGGGRDQQRGGGRGGRDQQRGGGDEDHFELDDAEDALEAREERIERGMAAAQQMGLAPTIVDESDQHADADAESAAEPDEERGGADAAAASERDAGDEHGEGDAAAEEPPAVEAEGGRRRRRRRGRGGAKREPAVTPAAPAEAEDADLEDFESRVEGDADLHEGAVDIDEGPDHTIGERPAGEFDRHEGREGGGRRRRRRGRRGRGASGRGGDNGEAQQPADQQQPRPEHRDNRRQQGGGGGGGGRAGGGQRNEPQRHQPSRQQQPPRQVARDQRAGSLEAGEHEEDESSGPGNTLLPAETTGNAGESAGRRRRRRGGRRRRGRAGESGGAGGGGGKSARPTGPKDPLDAIAEEQRRFALAQRDEDYEHDVEIPPRDTRSSTSAENAVPRQSSPPPPLPVVKTGSTDRHQIDDEPIAPQPVSRPRSYRDLDEIPDDFD